METQTNSTNGVKPVRWRIYPTLLDAYADYLDSADIYDRYWGQSERPPFSYEEFEARQYRELMDKLNRREREPSEAAARGTVFNALVDAMITGKPEARYDIRKEYGDATEPGRVTGLSGSAEGFTFTFDLDTVKSMASRFAGAMPQVLVKAPLDTCYGRVELYGYIDELMPLSCHDIKTTGSYAVGKFKDHAQHRAYLYCLDKSGSQVDTFVYDILELDRRTGAPTGMYTETYGYNAEDSERWLRERCQELIAFVMEHRGEISNERLIVSQNDEMEKEARKQ